MSAKLLLGWVPLSCSLLCLDWVGGLGSQEGLGVRWRGLGGGINGVRGKRAKMLELVWCFGSRRVEGISWGHGGPRCQGPSFCGGRNTQLSSRLFLFFLCAPKKKPTRKENLPIEIPVFILCDVYKYFPKREMICLCNIPLDLQSDAIAEPKTKARVIFLTDVNRRCTREFTVEHWNKMWGDYWAVCVGRLCLRIEKKYWLVCQERSVIASWNCLVALLSLINRCRFLQAPGSIYSTDINPDWTRSWSMLTSFLWIRCLSL